MLEQLIKDEKSRLDGLIKKKNAVLTSDVGLANLRKRISDAEAALEDAVANHSVLNALDLLIDQQNKSIHALENPVETPE